MLTHRMLHIYETICAWRSCYGVSPTIRELTAACGLRSHGSMYITLCEMRERGQVIWRPGMARTLRVV
jgi:SOS-response transcriptional repressor LexA